MFKQIFKTPDVTVTNTADLEGVGSIRIIGSSFYRWVQNTAAAALAAGDAAFHSASNGATVDQLVIQGITAQLGFMAGVVQPTILPPLAYGWVQIFGYCSVVNVNNVSGAGAIAAGDQLQGVNGQNYFAHGTASGTAPLFSKTVLAMEALASSSTVTTAMKGFVSCL